MSLGQHLMLRLTDDRVIAPSPVERRVVARVVLEQGRREDLLAFGLADTHLHLEAGCTDAAANQLARRIEISLGRRLRLPVGFAKPHIVPIENLHHCYRAFTYVLEQCTHHGLEWDPLHEASNLPDLLGMRLIGAYTAGTVRRLLPRIRRADLLKSMGLDELLPADGPFEGVVPAAVAAAAVPSLAGRSPEIVAARHAIVEVIGRRASAAELSRLLGLSSRMIHGLRQRPADRRLVEAIRLQLALVTLRGAALLRRERPFVEAAPALR